MLTMITIRGCCVCMLVDDWHSKITMLTKVVGQQGHRIHTSVKLDGYSVLLLIIYVRFSSS